MSAGTRIEWTNTTWNPVTGCDPVSPGCDRCYAAAFAERWRGIPGHPFERGFDVTLRPERLAQPFRWARPQRIFVNSMSDLFHDQVPDEFIAQVLAVMALTPAHTYQILTKRHGRLRSFFTRPAEAGAGWLPGSYATWAIRDALEHIRRAGSLGAMNPLRLTGTQWAIAADPTGVELPLPNIWLGVSAENQQWAGIRVPALLDTPAAVRFVSAEPLLGPVDLHTALLTGGIGWVIAGGESGPGARPCDLGWLRSLRDQCADTNVPFFCKQLGTRLGRRFGAGPKGGNWDAWPEDLRIREFPPVREEAGA